MNAQRPTPGTAVRIDCHSIDLLIRAMEHRGYQVIGPTVRDSAITLGPVRSVDDLPKGWTSEQEPGKIRLKRRTDEALFAYTVGPKSLKNFLHPSEISLFRAERENGAFRIVPNADPPPRQAFL